MKAKELREKTDAEREKLLTELQFKAHSLRFGIASRETKNIKEYRAVKKTIARLITLAAEKGK